MSVAPNKGVMLFGTTWTLVCQAPLSMEFSRHEYWSGLPFPSPGDLLISGIKPRSPALQADSFPSEPLGKHKQTTEVLLQALLDFPAKAAAVFDQFYF